MKRLFSFFLTIVIFLSTFFCFSFNVSAATLPDLPEDKMVYILVDAHSGMVIAEHNSQQKVYPASLTKMMTAIVSLDNESDLTKEMTAYPSALVMNFDYESGFGLKGGEIFRFGDLLHAILIRSVNECANIVAENISGSQVAFVELMNQKAQSLGLVNTHFSNTYGLHESEHYTTAADVAVIAETALCYPTIRSITTKSYYSMPPTNKHNYEDWAQLYTTNNLLNTVKFPNSSFTVSGLKTGFTNAAGYCLAASAYNSNGMEIIAIVMNASSSSVRDKFTDALLKYAFDNYERKKVISKYEVMAKKNVANAIEEDTKVNIVSSDDFYMCMRKGDNTYPNIEPHLINDIIEAPVEVNQVLGYADVVSNGITMGRISLISANSIERAPAIIPTPDVPVIGSEATLIPEASPTPKGIKDPEEDPFKDKLIYIIVLSLVLFGLFLSGISYIKYMNKNNKNKHRSNRTRRY